jgi:hypothetical protein
MDLLRYFAVWFPQESGWSGYVLDFYPAEEKLWRRKLGRQIIGTYETQQEADAVIKQRLAKCWRSPTRV